MSSANTTLPSLPVQDCDPLLDSVAAKVIKTAAYSILLLLSLVGNSVVPAVVYRNLELHTSVNYFIASMSISDLLIPIFTLTVRIKRIYVPQDIWHIHGTFGSFLCKLSAFATDTSIIVTVLSLMIVSLERLFAVVYPLRTQPLRSRKSCFIAISLTWIFAMLYSSQNFYTLRLQTVNGTSYCYHSWEPAFTVEVMVVETILFQVFFSIIPFVVLTSLYCTVIVSLRRKKSPGQSERNQSKRKNERYRRITYMLMTSVVVFLVPSTAATIYVFWAHFVRTGPPSCSNRHITFVLTYLSYTYQAFNPYIYCIFNKRYRKGFKPIFCCGNKCKFCTKTGQKTQEQVPMEMQHL